MEEDLRLSFGCLIGGRRWGEAGPSLEFVARYQVVTVRWC